MMTADNLHKKKQRGFTLLEIMVSMVVLGLVLVTLFKLQSSTIGLAGAGKFYSIAPWLAREQLAVLVRGAPTNQSGAFEGPFKGYEWSCEIENGAFEEDGAFPGLNEAKSLKRINLEITGSTGGRQYKITTWRYWIEKEKS